MSKSYDHKKTVDLLGREPINPVGSCFDSVGHQLFDWLDKVPFKICHGIGVATIPGQEGQVIGHAWLERDGFAFDTTWGAKCPIEKYRRDLGLTYVVEYSPMQFFAAWVATNNPGPWDEKIRAITDSV